MSGKEAFIGNRRVGKFQALPPFDTLGFQKMRKLDRVKQHHARDCRPIRIEHGERDCCLMSLGY